MGHQGDQLAAGLVDGLEGHDPGLGLRLLPSLFDDARQEIGHGPQLGRVPRREVARLLGLHVEHAHHLVVPREGHGKHRGDEAPLVEASDPQEPRVGSDVRDDQRFAGGGHPPRHAFPERHTGAPDLEAVEAVRGGQRQVGPVAVEEVQRGHVGVQRVARLVDDRLQEFVPRARGGGQASHAVQEAQLLELLRTVRREADRIDHQDHDTNGTEPTPLSRLRPGCGRRAPR
jgi:hypothetical protein